MSYKDFKNFLFISKGFYGEVRSMMHFGLKLKCWSEQDIKDIFVLTMETSKMLSGFIKVF